MIYSFLQNSIADFAAASYGIEPAPGSLQVQKTRKEFDGDFTVVTFSLSKNARKAPEAVAEELGKWLVSRFSETFHQFNVVKGFLNLTLTPDYWMNFLRNIADDVAFGTTATPGDTPVLVEFSSPNTNKPLHLGHIRNNLLGHSVSEILKAAGHRVVKLNLVNDRGIHICKSMLAWQRWGNGETPGSSGIKGDHLVGKYYVLFDKHYKEELKKLRESGLDEPQAEAASVLMADAREMLRQWENGNPEVRALWSRMNQWVYEGFEATYKRMNITFDQIDYESDTYLLGKNIVLEGVSNGTLEQREDDSVWADLRSQNLDEKLLLRSDGTSVYMTQDIGTACKRYEQFKPSTMIYVVGNEQNYHFDVLKRVLGLIGYGWSENIHHLSYGMVELPQGKMKSREGTVVDADDLMTEMYETARSTTLALGKTENFSPQELDELFHMLGLGALKYFILKVDPRKTMLFNPEESIDFNGHTGPFIQYTHARIRSVLRKAAEAGWNVDHAQLLVDQTVMLPDKERQLLRLVADFPTVLEEAATALSPASIANYVYELAREYNQFYHEFSILHEPNKSLAALRLALSVVIARILQRGMGLLGIDVPERM